MISIAALVLSLISAAVLVFLIARHGIDGIVDIPKIWIYYSLAISIIAVGLSNYQLARLDRSSINPTAFSRFAGVIATLDISTVIALMIIAFTSKATEVTDATDATATEKLTSTSYIILAVTTALMVGGLSWCFWRAMTAPKDDDKDVQQPSS